MQYTPVRREIPIFGAPFGFNVFILGMIDEIRVDPQTFDFDLLEFKTRAAFKSLPSKAQSNVHKLQVYLYYNLTGKLECIEIFRGFRIKTKLGMEL